ncbi:hypothetical protein LAZ67_2002887 [Cordylochernes scorpioides]|uniref:RNase H type-1 domain-containing protein n=1 Tax=Cordylochernes scorpioides TaxID=51811 RepID=A0ABY6K583_9ARAC|nr:hypothetical protein LAZ67_2002887 [Cordylochernes scorpioides]
MFRPSQTIFKSSSQASSLLGRVSQCSNAISGLGFVARRRFYLGVVEPTITYTAPICSDVAKLRIGKASLRSTQRKFCIHAIRGFHTVPTLTAIALLCILPLNLKVVLLSSLLRPPDTLPFTPESPLPLFAECFAFRTALSDLCSLPPSLSTAISSDRISLLSALSFPFPHSPHPLVAQCQTLFPSSNLTLHWVKGHSGNPGNCQADTLAKDEFILARPSFFLKLGLTPSSLSSSHSFLLPSTAIATSLLTGHTFIAAFIDPTCPHCNQAPETIDHIFFDCPNLDSLRAIFFHKCLTDLGLIPTSLPQLFSSGKAWALALDLATQSNSRSACSSPPLSLTFPRGGRNAVSWPAILESFGSGVDLLSSDSQTLQLQLLDENMNILKVNNASGWFTIIVPRKSSSSSDTEDGLPEPTYVQPLLKPYEDMMYHQVIVDKADSAVNLEIHPERPDADLLIFLRHRAKPLPHRYDLMVPLRSLTPNSNGHSSSTRLHEFYIFATRRPD